MPRQSRKRMAAMAMAACLIAIGVLLYKANGKKAENELVLYGNVDLRQVRLAFHASGRITDLYLSEGDRVTSGQLVGELDPARYEAATARARAAVEAQKELLAKLLSGSRPEEIAAARAEVKAAEARFEDARQTYERARKLAETQFLSRQDLDNACAAFKAASAELDARRQALALAMEGPRQEDIEAARARLEAERAALKLAEKELADTKLYSPVDGVIQERIMEPGDMASPQTPVYLIAQTSPLWVRAYVDEPDLGKIAPGMKASVTTDSFPGKVYRGWVGFISPTAEFTPKAVQTEELRSKLVYQVRIFVCDPQNELRLGMPATVKIELGQKPGGTVNRCGLAPYAIRSKAPKRVF